MHFEMGPSFLSNLSIIVIARLIHCCGNSHSNFLIEFFLEETGTQCHTIILGQRRYAKLKRTDWLNIVV